MTQFIDDLTDYLTHLSVANIVVTDAFGGTSVTTCNTFSCFAYFGELQLSVDPPNIYSAPIGWSAIFNTDANTFVVVGSLITGVKDQDDLTIINTAEVTKVIPYRHWDTGLEFLVAELKLN